MRNFFGFFGLLLLSGCSTLPAANKVSEFADAATTGTGLLKSAVASNRTLALRIGEEEQVGNFLVKSRWSLGDRPSVMLSKVGLRPRLAALDALNKYAAALKLAADQGMIDNLEKAASNLGASIKGVATLASPASAPIAGPAITVASRGVGLLLGDAYANEIHAIIVAHDEDVQAVTKLLKVDLGQIGGVLKMQLDDYEKQRKLSLMEIQSDPSVDRLALYKEYKVAREDINSLKAQAAAIENYEELLTGLAQAHSAIAQDAPDAQLALNKFTALASDLAALASIVK
jgi:hypothetical protein